MKVNSLARPLAIIVAAISIILAGLLTGPAAAGDDNGLGAPPSSDPTGVAAAAGDAYIFREHSTANHERVDLFDDRIDKVQNDHNVNFSALVRAVEWARGPRMATCPDGIDRGIYQYRIYEYATVNGNLQKTGRWVIIQSIIEGGRNGRSRVDGHCLPSRHPVWRAIPEERQVMGSRLAGEQLRVRADQQRHLVLNGERIALGTAR